MIKALLLASALIIAPFSANAGFFGGNTTNNYETTNISPHSTSKSKSKASARAEASASSSSRSGAAAGAISGGNKLKGGDVKTDLVVEGDTVDAAPAQAGTVINNVAYECGGTAGAYASGPGLSVGGGTAFAFETCEDVFVARVGVEYGIEGAAAFLKAIVERRAADFAARRAVQPTGNVNSTRD